MKNKSKPTNPLLLCFFVWLFSSSTIVEEAWKYIIVTMKRAEKWNKVGLELKLVPYLCGAVFSIMEVKLITDIAEQAWWDSSVINI